MSRVQVKNACKPLLVSEDRFDLFQFVRSEIHDLSKDETIDEVTAELVIEKLLEKHPEKIIYEQKKRRQLTAGQQRHADALLATL